MTLLRPIIQKAKSSRLLRPLLLKVRDAVAMRNSLPTNVSELNTAQPPIELGPNEAIRVLFVAQHSSIWTGWRSVWKAMSKDSRFTVRIVLAPFIHSFSSASVAYDDMRRCLIDGNAPFSTMDYFNLDDYRPHVVFVQNPYEETRPEEFRIDSLLATGARVAYIPYGLEIGGGAWNISAQFDSRLHRTAWRIFARSERHKKMYAKYCSAGNSHVAVTGHPKFDQSIDESKLSLPNETTIKIAGRKVILWTPHFSVSDTPAWSTYRLYADHIFSEFAKRPDLFLLLRPHPLFFKAMIENRVWDAEGEKAFRQFINNSSNIGLDESSDYHAAFTQSDALMTDVGSFLFEYLPIGKPLLYLHHPDGLGMNDDGELTDSLYKASEPEDITDFVEMVMNGQDSLKSERESILPEFLFGLGGNIGENICQHIHAAIAKNDTWHPKLVNHKSSIQQSSERYWKNASNTFLESPEYYATKEVILGEVLQQLPVVKKGLNIGCGDGKFAFQLAKHCEEMHAYDVSHGLIEKAQKDSATLGITNTKFFVQELENIAPFEKYDLVACMGVTSCIIDDTKFLSILDKFKALCRQEGYLILIDTLSSGQEQLASSTDGYIEKHRSLIEYKSLILRRGFTLKVEALIKESADSKLVNKLFLFKYSGQK